MLKPHVGFEIIKASVPRIRVIYTAAMTNTVNSKELSYNNMDNHTDTFQNMTKLASKSLLAGNVIGLPTDTIYGVAGLAQSTEAVKRIYSLKHRPPGNPVAICVADVGEVNNWANVIISDDLLRRLLPGPVTLIFERRSCLNPGLNPDTKLVGVRIPHHEFIRQVCRTCGGPLALTSANISGCPSTLSVEEFSPKLREQLDMIVDGGCLSNSEKARLGSTVVDLSQSKSYTIIRPGSARDETVAVLEEYGLQEMKR